MHGNRARATSPPRGEVGRAPPWRNCRQWLCLTKRHSCGTRPPQPQRRLPGIVLHGEAARKRVSHDATVLAREGTAGRYVFIAPLWDEDDLSLELRLDFSDDRGLCDCNAGNATILFEQLLSSSPVHIAVLPAASGPSAASSMLHEGYGQPKGRWLRANCNGTGAGASAHRRFEERACAAHNTHAPADLMRRRPWLYVPYRGAHSYRVLPLDFVRGTYWLHEEGDSTILRGEKEDLVWLLYGANITALRRTPVICIYAGQGAERAEFKREGCGTYRTVGYGKTCASPRAPPAAARTSSPLLSPGVWHPYAQVTWHAQHFLLGTSYWQADRILRPGRGRFWQLYPQLHGSGRLCPVRQNLRRWEKLLDWCV